MGINRVMRAPTMVAPVRGYATNATNNATDVKPDQSGDVSGMEEGSRNISLSQVQNSAESPMTVEGPRVAESKQRKLLHTRQVTCCGYQRDDGRWEIEGRMTDLKNFPLDNPDRGQIPVGEPLHDIALSLVIDSALRIHQVHAEIEAAPFNQCAAITDAFQTLEGLSLTPGFNRQAKELLGGVNGCTHLLELLGPIATTAYQTLWQSEQGYDVHSPEVERLLDSCHTWSRDGGAAAKLLAEMRESSAALREAELQPEKTS